MCHCERWFRIFRCIYWHRSSASQVTAEKVMDLRSRFQDVQNKQLRSVRWNPGHNGRCINVIKNQNQNVQIFGNVHQNTNGQNHGPVRKTQSFLSKGICAVIFWQDYFGKGNSRKSYWNMAGRKGPNLRMSIRLEHGLESFKIENVYWSYEQEDCSYQCMWTISNWQAKQKTWNRHGKFECKTLIWENQHHFLTTKIRVALKESVISVKIWWQTTKTCSNGGFLLEPKKNYRPELQGNRMQKQYLLGPMSWSVTQRYCEWNNWAICNAMHGWSSIWRRKMNQLETCLLCAHKMFWNVCI